MENILFIRLRLLGDVIFTIPSIQIFKKHYPESKIYYVVEEKFQEIAQLIPGIDELIIVPYKMGFREIREFRKRIKSIGINTVIDFHSGPKSALLTFSSGAKTRIGYKTPNRNWAYTHKIPRKFKNNVYTHSVYNQAKLLSHLDIPIDESQIPYYPQIPLNPFQAPENLKELLKKNKQKKIVVHVGAKKKFRDWGIENFHTLIKTLKSENFSIFLIGNSDDEKNKGEYLQKECNIYNFTGTLSIHDTLYLISQCDLYVGVDSGPLHMATLTKTPIIALYGPNTPKVSGPWRKDGIEIIKLNLSCQPCTQKKCNYDTIRCMKEISPGVVYEAIIKHFK